MRGNGQTLQSVKLKLIVRGKIKLMRLLRDFIKSQASELFKM